MNILCVICKCRQLLMSCSGTELIHMHNDNTLRNIAEKFKERISNYIYDCKHVLNETHGISKAFFPRDKLTYQHTFFFLSDLGCLRVVAFIQMIFSRSTERYLKFTNLIQVIRHRKGILDHYAAIICWW